MLPITTAVWGGFYMLCRLGYICAYMSAPKRRQWFVPLIMFTQVAMPLFACVAAIVLYVNEPFEGLDTIKSGMHTGFWGNEDKGAGKL